MEVAAAATAMDFHALSRRELQALCKRNGVRANMTNAAMADALQLLSSVDGIDEIGTTLCLPTPSRSTMKSALKAAAAIGEEEQQQQQHGSPLPRGRRVSVKSPEAIRMDVEEGEDEMKPDLVKEIVRTPGVALRSTSRRARATPAAIPTPATTRRTAAARKTEEAAPTPATLRRSQRTAARKASSPVVVEVTATKTTTRRSARSKVMIDLDQEVEDMAGALQEVNVQEAHPKDAASDEKCDDFKEEEATKILERNGKEEESGGEEVVSSAAPTEIAAISVKSSDDPKEGETVATGEESAKTQEVEGVGKEQELVSVENSAPLPTMEDSPILGVLSKPEPVEPLSEKVEGASVGDGLGFGQLSALKEITGEMNDKGVNADEVPEEKLPADVTGDKTSEEDDLNEVKEVSAVEMPQADLTVDETSEEGASHEMPQADLTDAETSEGGDLDEESPSEESEESDPSEVSTDSDEEVVEIQQFALEDGLTAETNHFVDEEDDFSSDLPLEFDNAGNFSDAESEKDTTVVTSSAAKAAAVKSLDDSSVTEASSEDVSQQEVEDSLNSIVKSLDEFTFTVEGTQKDELAEEMKSSDDAEAVGAKELQKEKKKKKKLTVEDLNATSLRKLKTMYKDELIAKAAAEGKRLALAELDDNAGGVDC